MFTYLFPFKINVIEQETINHIALRPLPLFLSWYHLMLINSLQLRTNRVHRLCKTISRLMKHYIHKTFIAVDVLCMKGGVHNLNEKREQKSVFKYNTRGKINCRISDHNIILQGHHLHLISSYIRYGRFPESMPCGKKHITIQAIFYHMGPLLLAKIT